MRKIIMPLIVLLLFSCGKNKKIIFQTDGCYNLEASMLGNDFTVFCYIDSTNCTVCDMQWLHLWTYHEEELKKLKTNVVLIVCNRNEDVIYDAMRELRLNFPVVFDGFSDIKCKNEIIFNHHSTFVVNNKKEVIFLGIPIRSKGAWNLFRKTILQHSIF